MHSLLKKFRSSKNLVNKENTHFNKGEIPVNPPLRDCVIILICHAEHIRFSQCKLREASRNTIEIQ